MVLYVFPLEVNPRQEIFYHAFTAVSNYAYLCRPFRINFKPCLRDYFYDEWMNYKWIIEIISCRWSMRMKLRSVFSSGRVSFIWRWESDKDEGNYSTSRGVENFVYSSPSNHQWFLLLVAACPIWHTCHRCVVQVRWTCGAHVCTVCF